MKMPPMIRKLLCARRSSLHAHPGAAWPRPMQAWLAAVGLALLPVHAGALTFSDNGLLLCDTNFTPECVAAPTSAPCTDSLINRDLRLFRDHAPRGFGICETGHEGLEAQSLGFVIETGVPGPCPLLLMQDGTFRNAVGGGGVEPTAPPAGPQGPRPNTFACEYTLAGMVESTKQPPLQSEQTGSGLPRCAYGNPCDASTGNKFEHERDYDGAVALERFYNSLLDEQLETRLGAGWSHSYSGRIVPTSPEAQWIDVIRPDGRLDRFRARHDADDLFVADNDTSLTVRRDVPAGEWSVVHEDGTQEIYAAADGRLLRLIAPSGHETTLVYDDDADPDSLDRVRGPFGHELRFEYEAASGLLARVIDPAGGYIDYTHAGGTLTVVTYQDTTTRTYHYEDAAFPLNLTGITDENGDRYSTFAYDANGLAVLSEHAQTETPGVGQHRFTLHYGTDAEGNRLTTVTDARGHVRQVTFPDRDGRLLAGRIEHDGGSHLTRDYDDHGRLGERVDENGLVSERRYDEYHLTERIEARGTPLERRTTYTAYLEPATALVTEMVSDGVTGPQTRFTSTTYDGHQPQTVTVSGYRPVEGGAPVPVSRSTTRTYHQAGPGVEHVAGLLAAIDGPREDIADVTSFEYHDCNTGGACGQLWRVTDPGGHMTTFDAYDAHGRLAQSTAANGLVTQYAYDPRGRLETVTSTAPDGSTHTHSTSFDDAGQLTSSLDPAGVTLHYDYNAAHELERVTDALGNRVEYSYDAAGDRVAETLYSPDGTLRRSTGYGYDARGRRNAVTHGSSLSSMAHDDGGRPTETIDPNLNKTTRDYDELDRVVLSTAVADSASPVETRYGYDVADRLVTVEDARGVTTTYRYDDLGNLLAEESPDAGNTTYTVDAAGNMLTRTDARGVTLSYTYDALDRVTGVSHPDPAFDITYRYDEGELGVGQLTSVTDASGETRFEYDAFGNRVREVRTVDGLSLAIEYGYDAADRLTSMVYPSGIVLAFERDAAGQVTRITASDAGQSSVLLEQATYAPFGPVTGFLRGNGLLETRSYDAQYRLSALSSGAVLDLGYGYDANGNILRIDDYLAPTRDQTFDYDALDRLVSADAPAIYGLREYTYDALGNRLSRIVDGVTELYDYDSSSNRLLDVLGPEARSFGYDASGNVTGVGTDTTYGYDPRGRLETVTEAGVEVATYRYDAFERRIVKDAQGERTVFLYNQADQLIAEVGEDGRVRREHVYLGTTPVAVLAPDVVTGPLEVTTTSLPPADIGTPYTRALFAVGGKLPYGWSLVAGALPAGLTLAANGTISGIASQGARESVTVQVVDALGASAVRTLTLETLGPVLSLALDAPDAGQYGHDYGSDEHHSLLAARFTATGQDLWLAVTGYDVDELGEVAVYLNDALLGQLSPGPDQGLNAGDSFALPAAAQAPGENRVEFRNLTPGRVWGVSGLLLSAGPLAIETVMLPELAAGEPAEVALAASGAILPYTWSVAAGTLPAGLTLDTDGLLAGTPTVLGSEDVTVRVSDASGQSVEQLVTVDVVPPRPVLTVGVVDTVQYGHNYGTGYHRDVLTATFESPGEDLSFDVTGYDIDFNDEMALYLNGTQLGYLSTGPNNGLNAGDRFWVLSEAQQPGENVIEFRQRTSGYKWGVTDLLLTAWPVQVDAQSLPDAVVGESYAHALSASGGTVPYTWSLIGGALPDGLTLGTDGVISGTPGAGAVTSFVVRALDSLGQQSSERELTLDASGPVLELTPGVQHTGEYGHNYGPSSYYATLTATFTGTSDDQWLELTGYDIDQADEVAVTLNGALLGYLTPGPANGLNAGDAFLIPAAAQLSGLNTVKLRQSTPGFTWGVTDVVLSTAPLAIDTLLLPDARIGELYAHSLAASGGSTPYVWSLAAGTLPAGITLASDGTLAGTAVDGVVTDPTLRVTDSLGTSKERVFMLDVSTDAVALVAEVPDTGQYGHSYGTSQHKVALALTFAGAAGDLSLELTGYDIDFVDEVSIHLNGMQLGYLSTGPNNGYNAGDHFIIPLSAQLPGENVIKLRQRTSGFKWGVTNLVLTATPLTLDTESLPHAIIGESYTASLAASGGIAPHTWSLATGALPAGFTLAADGTLTGTGSSGARAIFTARVTDAIGARRNQPLVLDVTGPPLNLVLGVTDTGQYGYNYGASTHYTALGATFTGTGTDRWLELTGYDIDYSDEVAVYLNDTLLGYLVTGPNNGYNAGEVLLLPASAQVVGTNTLEFRQKTAGWKWGVTNLLLSDVPLAANAQPLHLAAQTGWAALAGWQVGPPTPGRPPPGGGTQQGLARSGVVTTGFGGVL